MRKIPLGNLNSNNPIKTSVKKYHASVARQSPRERNRLLACKNFAFTQLLWTKETTNNVIRERPTEDAYGTR